MLRIPRTQPGRPASGPDPPLTSSPYPHSQTPPSNAAKVSSPKLTMTNKQASSFPDTTSLLRYVYEDLSRFSEVVSTDIVLHSADRDLSSPPKPPLRGVEAAQAHEDALIAATGGTLVMDVQTITANEHFGSVMGVLRASKAGRKDLAIPFCGVWRFEGGLAIEHWENAVDPGQFALWLQD
ncbi:hypothetical protein QBC34DRAFT_452814 [Podospora aff. communis PSN243]|uniref:SnoaL-like domain-containing protein n=1 Tax=Podospora aff. communis PSN243 TaxID=3040156 RepID=A0AAV9G167_9PEZI|nr:hypothetical protein QBC34DRAFT_452814 [Podospora aff. communis PSN243]